MQKSFNLHESSNHVCEMRLILEYQAFAHLYIIYIYIHIYIYIYYMYYILYVYILYIYILYMFYIYGIQEEKHWPLTLIYFAQRLLQLN